MKRALRRKGVAPSHAALLVRCMRRVVRRLTCSWNVLAVRRTATSWVTSLHAHMHAVNLMGAPLLLPPVHASPRLLWGCSALYALCCLIHRFVVVSITSFWFLLFPESPPRRALLHASRSTVSAPARSRLAFCRPLSMRPPPFRPATPFSEAATARMGQLMAEPQLPPATPPRHPLPAAPARETPPSHGCHAALPTQGAPSTQ